MSNINQFISLANLIISKKAKFLRKKTELYGKFREFIDFGIDKNIFKELEEYRTNNTENKNTKNKNTKNIDDLQKYLTKSYVVKWANGLMNAFYNISNTQKEDKLTGRQLLYSWIIASFPEFELGINKTDLENDQTYKKSMYVFSNDIIKDFINMPKTYNSKNVYDLKIMMNIFKYMFDDYVKIKKYEETIELVNEWKSTYTSYNQVQNSNKYDIQQKEECLKQIKKHMDNIFVMIKKHYNPEMTEEALIKLAEFDEQVNDLADFMKKKKVSEDLKAKNYDLVFDIINNIKETFIKMLELVPKHYETISKFTLERKLHQINHINEIHKTMKKEFNLDNIKENLIADFDLEMGHKIAENDIYIENVNLMLNQDYLLEILEITENIKLDDIINYGENLVGLINYLQSSDCIEETVFLWGKIKESITQSLDLQDSFSEVLFFIVKEIEKIKLRILGIKIAKDMNIPMNAIQKPKNFDKSCGKSFGKSFGN